MQENRFSKLIIAVTIAGSLSPVMRSANADEIVETRRTTTIESPAPYVDSTTTTTNTTTERSVVVTPGDSQTVIPTTDAVTTETVVPVPLSFGDAHTILQTIDLRRSEIDKKIVEARSSGSLSEAQSADLRKELDRIGAQISELKAQDNPSIARSLSLAQDLDALTGQVRTVYSSVQFVPIIEGSHFTIFNGHIVQLDDIAVRRIGLENKILERQNAGRISYQQSNDLRSELSSLAAREDVYRSAGLSGKLSDREARELYAAFDRVANKLDSYSGTR
jgi:hypothetical protein